jgi:anti-sigma regulatory factor (Ser/Thr protein kinase)
MVSLILPSRLVGNNLFHEFGRFMDANPILPEEVQLDFSNLSFARPPSVAFLSNFTHWFVNAGSSVKFTGTDIANQAIKYLDDAQFFELHTGSKIAASSSCRPTTIPVRQVARSASHGWLEFDFLPWLMRHSGLTRSSLAEVKTCMQELFNNISDHTLFDEGCVFGQWYPNEKKIIVSIGDFGTGIPKNVAKVVPGLSHNEAIVRAAEDGFSSQSLPTNRGAGLYLLLLNVVQRFNGHVTIRSGAGYVKFEKFKNDIYTYCQHDCGYCIGTIIDIVLYTDRIPYAEEEEEFEWI